MSEYIHGDCMDYLTTFADNEFDLAIVDPPYGGGCSQDTSNFNGAIVGRFGGRFSKYHLVSGVTDGRDVGGKVPVKRGCL